jgi:hypothetical protein
MSEHRCATGQSQKISESSYTMLSLDEADTPSSANYVIWENMRYLTDTLCETFGCGVVPVRNKYPILSALRVNIGHPEWWNTDPSNTPTYLKSQIPP